jgi:hypothetical protein
VRRHGLVGELDEIGAGGIRLLGGVGWSVRRLVCRRGLGGRPGGEDQAADERRGQHASGSGAGAAAAGVSLVHVAAFPLRMADGRMRMTVD